MCDEIVYNYHEERFTIDRCTIVSMETQELRITYINCEIPENQNSIALFLNFHWTQRARLLSVFNHIPTRNGEYFKIRCKECAYNNISRIPTTYFSRVRMSLRPCCVFCNEIRAPQLGGGACD